ncbi:560_t:CDS:2 [Entrophospora sp. SA101]|nr:11701_t:CDS:2 [Entrophospora sp. SA101]CAJ0650738.1 7125_t:CDS:2 [Entrophospora sp. SA101]CAJ0759911.1 560_t:CDS:2 [Entrophospora sp. SA101]CAJ0847889.1 12385_t:CDS:2 [Entrophospora sp. SA101]CAJ0877057.1 2651_t:CDS:2 [Entrophospora sp. SA101]
MFFCGIYYDIQEPELAKALRTIFPKASKSEIHKYMKQLSDVEEGDPVLIIIPNPQWVNQHGQNAYNTVMDAFATVNIHRANQRRDKNSSCIFHFRDMEELYNVRKTIRTSHPHAFFIQPPYNAHFPDDQLIPIGAAWYLFKTGEAKTDFAEDEQFFVFRI